MSDKPSPVSVPFDGQFNINYLKAGEHSLLIPIPERIATLIGLIAVQWGAFEIRMDTMIETVCDRLGRKPPPLWKTLSFRQRKKLFRDTMAEYTGRIFPDESATFRKIVATAGDLHWRRNTVAHGYIVIGSVPDHASETGHRATYTAFGTHKGRQTKIELTEEGLDKLRHDIMHLGGALIAAIHRMGGGLDQPELVIADRDLLQDQQSGSFQMLPIARIPQSLPGPWKVLFRARASFVRPWRVGISGTPSGK
jgi:hypothetical protein